MKVGMKNMTKDYIKLRNECLQEVMEVVDLFRGLGYSIEDVIYAARVFEGLDDKEMIDGIYSTFGSLTRY